MGERSEEGSDLDRSEVIRRTQNELLAGEMDEDTGIMTGSLVFPYDH